MPKSHDLKIPASRREKILVELDAALARDPRAVKSPKLYTTAVTALETGQAPTGPPQERELTARFIADSTGLWIPVKRGWAIPYFNADLKVGALLFKRLRKSKGPRFSWMFRDRTAAGGLYYLGDPDRLLPAVLAANGELYIVKGASDCASLNAAGQWNAVAFADYPDAPDSLPVDLRRMTADHIRKITTIV